jgi:hypothetical protein
MQLEQQQLNRAQRRALKHKKAVAERVIPLPPAIDEWNVFSMQDEFLRKLKKGYLDVVQGDPVFKDHSGEMLQLLPAMAGWIETWEYVERKNQVELKTAAWRKIFNKLYYNSPIRQIEIEALAQSIDLMKQEFRRDRKNITELAKNMQIKLLMTES